MEVATNEQHRFQAKLAASWVERSGASANSLGEIQGYWYAPIALSRVSCRGVFSRRKRCRVRNSTAGKLVALRFTKAGSGAQLSLSALPGNGVVVDPRMRATSRSTSNTGLCAYDRDPRH